ncbi:hypothetical protein [Ensifer adhaerens]|uniref:hypothetical protein n=1 Tax=Ensifer adhaerens TaxID=106592 RepID=UPI00131A013C|nr:hypothetical protein [Ensifer adhaerens]
MDPLESRIASSGLTLPRSRQDLIFNDQHIILEAVKEGQGVALIYRTMVLAPPSSPLQKIEHG